MPAIKRLTASCLVLAWLLGYPLAASAAQPAPPDQVVWSVDAKVKRLFNSHTSYEFGNPYPPRQAPLSRLEFGLNSWWGGLEVSRWTPRWSVRLEALTNLARGVDGILADSDWDDETRPTVRDIYSESNLRLKPSYDVRASLDVSVASWLGLPRGLDLRPVGGVRWQRFDLLAFDGTQWEYGAEGDTQVTPLPGNVIRFRQTYWHYFLGLRAGWRPLPRRHPGFQITGQVDWAYVKGDNKDHHLLRAGTRITQESTSGHAWHAALGVEAPLGCGFFLGIQADYLYLTTTGSHHLEGLRLGYRHDLGQRGAGLVPAGQHHGHPALQLLTRATPRGA